MTATLTLPYDTAKLFARDWSRFSLRGYSMSAKREDSTALTLDNLTPPEIAWIDARVADMNRTPKENQKK